MGLLIAPTETIDVRQQAIGEMKRVIEDPSYRDTLGQILRPLVYLLGSELIRRGLQEPEPSPGDRDVIYKVSLFVLEMEDRLQRVQIPEQWWRPGAGKVREIAGQIWDGSLDEELSPSLGQEYIEELLRLWQERTRTSQILCSRLKTLIAIQPFSGGCSECKGW